MTVRLRLRVTATAEKALRSGHPWLFAESVREQNRKGGLGELAVIYDRDDRFLAIGLFDPQSPIRVRILHAGAPEEINDSWWVARLQHALERRREVFDEQTTGFRWINGESDGWPGLVLDRYDRTLVLKLYSAAWLARLDSIRGGIAAQFHPERIVLRLSRNIQEIALLNFSLSDGTVVHGPPLQQPVLFLESGLRFEADVIRGQKTGFFLDQRENRRKVQSLARDRTVLNTFSFSGAFSVYAARGGARRIVDLDISSHALAAAQRNFALNQSHPVIASCERRQIQADAFDWLAGNLEQKFDFVILDPPSLAKRESERAGAIRAYRTLTSLALSHLCAGGLLLAASCSAHVSAEEFFQAVCDSALGSGRRFEVMEATRHAVDHPAAFKEADYLKAIYLRFD
jgi:23S rRNA (cytosine1962-C5)-methyltransferase